MSENNGDDSEAPAERPAGVQSDDDWLNKKVEVTIEADDESSD